MGQLVGLLQRVDRHALVGLVVAGRPVRHVEHRQPGRDEDVRVAAAARRDVGRFDPACLGLPPKKLRVQREELRIADQDNFELLTLHVELPESGVYDCQSYLLLSKKLPTSSACSRGSRRATTG